MRVVFGNVGKVPKIAHNFHCVPHHQDVRQYAQTPLVTELQKEAPEMDATEALPVGDPSRQDPLRRGRVALGCVLSK